MAPGSTTELRAEGGGLALGKAPGRLALTATVAASGMASLDATVVNVALPHIGADLDASISSLQWVLTGYNVSPLCVVTHQRPQEDFFPLVIGSTGSGVSTCVSPQAAESGR